MIVGLFHPGSGTGNQLHRYVMTRVLALDKDCDFGMAGINYFKPDFLELDFGKIVPFPTYVEYPAGKLVVESSWPLFEENTSSYDWKTVDAICDKSIVDGEWQGEEYFEHHLPEIREWLKVEPLEMPDNLCIINFRGGEYKHVPELFLPREYWQTAIGEMLEINPRMKFEVRTDDIETAQKFFPDAHIFHHPEIDWRSIRYAKYLILSNSSFAILPALLNEDVRHIIAPKGWARRNIGEQMLQYNVYKKFEHL